MELGLGDVRRRVGDLKGKLTYAFDKAATSETASAAVPFISLAAIFGIAAINIITSGCTEPSNIDAVIDNSTNALNNTPTPTPTHTPIPTDNTQHSAINIIKNACECGADGVPKTDSVTVFTPTGYQVDLNISGCGPKCINGANGEMAQQMAANNIRP